MIDSALDKFPAETNSAQQTRDLGELLGRALPPGQVVAVFGELGTGKTQLVKGICRGLGIQESVVTSPTFTIINEYDGDPRVFHLDLYRIKSFEEALGLGIDEYLDSEEICLIEWPEQVESLLPDDTIGIRLIHRDGDRRMIECSVPNA
ncbi:MAG: tRNA (adenosine(37)-N6)-threonylcarbamoyltransferase complex ATPase subunit type 1 TsaE [Rhodothermia bacterium]|nr:MAG: tRNA (adenosine(37)-N6)-threonylcarbamoyltransferase complex ATPase subunit type 1 TsaE [Rhodothermia bacterium]